MKLVEDVEVEFIGEEGARLFAAFDPERDGIRLRVFREGVSRTVELDGEETSMLSEFLAEQVPYSARGKHRTLEFSADRAAVVFYPDNMGEPYRSGLTASLRSPAFGSVWVFLADPYAKAFRNFVAAHLRPAPPRPA